MVHHNVVENASSNINEKEVTLIFLLYLLCMNQLKLS